MILASTRDELLARERQRYPGYADEALAVATSVDGDRITWNTTTRAYQAWAKRARRRMHPPGLGDRVEALLNATRIGPVYQRLHRRLTGRPCGCGKRKRWLNGLLRFRR